MLNWDQWGTNQVGFEIIQTKNNDSQDKGKVVEVGSSGGCSSTTQLCLTLCNPMACSMPGLPVHHQPLELAQTHVYPVGDAILPSYHPTILPSHPLSSPSPPVFNLSQHQGQLFASEGQSIGVSALASVLPMNIQD